MDLVWKAHASASEFPNPKLHVDTQLSTIERYEINKAAGVLDKVHQAILPMLQEVQMAEEGVT
eukprot:2907559-Amphidinium_carterae.1